MTNLEASEQEMRIQERLDLAFTAVANENLKAVIVFRSTRGNLGQGGLQDGAGGAGGAGPVPGGANEVILGLNQGYMDFNWPGTSVNVKAGWMPVAPARGCWRRLHDPGRHRHWRARFHRFQ